MRLLPLLLSVVWLGFIDAFLSPYLQPETNSGSISIPRATKSAEDIIESHKQIKRLILIRHGLSYMNEYIGENGITFGGPNFTDIFDPATSNKYYQDSPLSPTGQEQAKELGEKIKFYLEEEENNKDTHFLRDLELIVVSPLSRAIQTAQLALFPHVDTDNIPVIALPLAAERLYLVSDIGRPASELKDKYGEWVDFQTGEDETMPWWYQHQSYTGSSRDETTDYDEWRPIGQGQAYFCPGEPYDAFQRRMLDLLTWLGDRPESTIALVGHYGVFEWLLHDDEEDQQSEKIKFSNCEMKVVPFEIIIAKAGERRKLQC